MKNLIFPVLFFVVVSACYSQATEVHYYKDLGMTTEVPEGKAKFSQTITHNADSSVTIEIKDLKSKVIVGGHPLRYSKVSCTDSIAGLKDYFTNNDSMHYVAPKLATGESHALTYIARNLRYPAYARENGIMGKIFVQFKVTEKGVLQDLRIVKGVDLSLDAEAIRVVENMKFSSPAMLNGQPKEICVRLPVNFVLK